MNNLIQVDNLNKMYGNVVVLNDVNLSVPQGKIVGLLGPNGCGKTTLMKILTGLICDYKGTVKIDGHQPDEYTKSIVSYLPDVNYFGNKMTSKKAIDLFANFYEDFDRVKADEMIRRLNMDPKQKCGNMSKGTLEKLMLTLVMSRRSKLYVLDEPLGGVDPATRSAILDTILNNYAENSSVLISTHLIYDVERIFDHVIMLGYGKILINDDVENIREESGKSIEDVFKEVFKC